MFKYFARVAAFAALLGCACAASAQTLTFQFTGTVTYTHDETLAPVGSQITGTFSYDEDTPAGITLPGYAAYQLPTSMSATVNGHDITSDTLNVEVFDNYGGNVEDTVMVSGASVMVDDALYVDGSINLSLASAAGNTQVLLSTDLPTIYHLAAFDSDANGQNVTYGVLQSSGAQGGVMLEFEIDSITGGHEPVICTNKKGKPKKCKKH